jgi:hypothetical protein
VDRALVLDPNLAWAWHMGGLAKCLLGEPKQAVEYAGRAMRLSPQDPQLFAMNAVVALGHFLSGHVDEAFVEAQSSLREKPNFLLSASVAAASAALLGRTAESEQAIDCVRQIHPEFRLSTMKHWLPFQRSKELDFWTDALRKAGLPD